MIKTWNTRHGVTVVRISGGRSNVFLVHNEHDAFLVDTSIKPERNRLMRRLSAYDKKQRINLLILTHTHFDHVSNAAFLKRKYDLKIAVHHSEAAFLEAGSSPLPAGQVGLLKLLNKLDKRKIEPLVRTEPAKADILLDESLDLSDRNIPVKIIHTPGHTRGSLSIIIDDEIAIVGDNMINTFMQRVFPPFCDDVPMLLDSWEKLLYTGCRLFLPSHGKEITRDQLRRSLDRKKLS